MHLDVALDRPCVEVGCERTAEYFDDARIRCARVRAFSVVRQTRDDSPGTRLLGVRRSIQRRNAMRSTIATEPARLIARGVTVRQRTFARFDYRAKHLDASGLKPGSVLVVIVEATRHVVRIAAVGNAANSSYP